MSLLRARFRLALSLVVLSGSTALAQQQETARTVTEAQGIKLTEGTVFHPGVEVSTGYQTNVFYEDDTVPENKVGSALTRVGVSGSIATLPAQQGGESTGRVGQKVAFRGDLSLTWNQYLSDDDRVDSQSDLGVGAIVDARFNPNGKVSVFIRDGFVRVVQPPRGYSADNVDRDKNEASIGVNFAPGGGAIQAYVSYTFTIDLFERSDLAFLNRLQHLFTMGARWQWLPRTQLNFETQVGIVTPDEEVVKSASVPLKIYAGLSTLVTPTFGAVVKLGYGNGFYNDGPSYSSYLAMVEGRLALAPTVRFAFGYTHDFTDSVVANFYQDHTIYARLAAQIAQRWQAQLRGDVRFRNYDYPSLMGGPFVLREVRFCGNSACTDSDRSDVVIGANASIDFFARNWFVIGASYSLLADNTDFYVEQSTGSMDQDPAEFLWQEVLLKVAARY